MALVDLDLLITLLLVDKVKKFRDSYSLTKVLAWKFDIINFVELTDKLISEEFLEVKIVNRIKNYEITNKGQLYLERYLEKSKPLILEKYPEEHEFINSLL